jgi:hypothetical protein
MRKVILHYHLFKNAGTSLDAAFKENFSEEKGEWVTKEFPAQPALNREQVKQWIIDNPQAKCFSSHTAIFPVPKIEGTKVIPVIFFRHPIDRIASAYSFEKKQGGSGFGPTLARNTTLAGYIETRLSLPNDRQCRNFHTHRLATMFGEKQGDEATRAKRAIKELPFVGLVEKFSASIAEIERGLRVEGFSAINLNPVEKNVSRQTNNSIEDKLIDLEEQVGVDVYRYCNDVNSIDLELWENIYSGL